MKIVGFPNLGNTCYLNSVLQCFIYNKDFQEIVENNDGPFVNCLKKIINKIKDESVIIVSELFQFFPFTPLHI